MTIGMQMLMSDSTRSIHNERAWFPKSDARIGDDSSA
ncbi:hypothetical protein SAMN05443244_0770 [Terriglobus roseus]|uniref:Uncharacterized protein n=1 Tax=Terriglobus roseus TaxID=392734 RepID=A0A1H4JS68_9BACT|nr:hypothetical protein SAMN05443244_0770 [Terriglobus roseus]